MSLLAPAPAAAASRWQRLRAPALTFGSLALATTALHVRDPHVQGSWGLCPSAAIGIWCPGCGGLRAVNDLTHGDLAAAASSNLLLVLAAPFVVVALLLWARDRWTGRVGRWASLQTLAVGWTLLTVTALFVLLRNLPRGAWLAP